MNAIRYWLLAILCPLIHTMPAFAQEETSTTMKMIDVRVEWERIAEGLAFPEGPAWDGRGTLYFSNCNGGYVSRVDSAGYAVHVPADNNYSFYERTNGLVVGKDGWIYACEWGKAKGAIHRISSDGVVEQFVSVYNGEPFRRPNDLAFDPNGNLYFTDPNSYGPEKPDGILYRVDAKTKEVTIADKDLCFCNGLAFTADGKKLILAESAKHRLLQYDVKPDGKLTNRRVFAEMPGGDPDGMNFDSAGNLYVAHFGGGAVWVFSPDGRLLKKIITPGKKPSNVDFGGEDMKTLFLTEDETESVYKTRVDVEGLPLFWGPLKQMN